MSSDALPLFLKVAQNGLEEMWLKAYRLAYKKKFKPKPAGLKFKPVD
jgi:hypothetical protein